MIAANYRFGQTTGQDSILWTNIQTHTGLTSNKYEFYEMMNMTINIIFFAFCDEYAWMMLQAICNKFIILKVGFKFEFQFDHFNKQINRV